MCDMVSLVLLPAKANPTEDRPDVCVGPLGVETGLGHQPHGRLARHPYHNDYQGPGVRPGCLRVGPTLAHISL